MIRRRILTGLVAAPFVARLGLLMPVRSVPVWSGVITIEWRLGPDFWHLPGSELDRALNDPAWCLSEIIRQTSQPPLITGHPELIAQIIDHRSTLALSSLRQPACGDPTCAET